MRFCLVCRSACDCERRALRSHHFLRSLSVAHGMFWNRLLGASDGWYSFSSPNQIWHLVILNDLQKTGCIPLLESLSLLLQPTVTLLAGWMAECGTFDPSFAASSATSRQLTYFYRSKTVIMTLSVWNCFKCHGMQGGRALACCMHHLSALLCGSSGLVLLMSHYKRQNHHGLRTFCNASVAAENARLRYWSERAASM